MNSLTNSGRNITESDYKAYLRYTTSLLFSNSRHRASDILHEVLEKAVVKNATPQQIMYNIRWAVMGKDRGVSFIIATEHPPPTSTRATQEDDLRLEDILNALSRVEIYHHGGKSIDRAKTTKAHKAVLMTAKGFSNQEIADELRMKREALVFLKHKANKRLKELI